MTPVIRLLAEELNAPGLAPVDAVIGWTTTTDPRGW